MLGTVEDDVFVHLVGEQQFQRVEVLGGQDAAGGIVRAVEDDQACLCAQRIGDGIPVRAIVRPQQWQTEAASLCECHGRFV